MNTAESAEGSSVRRSSNAIFGLGDQVLSSITNFGASGMALFVLSVADFGVFVGIQALYGIAVAVFRAAIGEPLLHPFGDLDLDEPSALRSAAIVGAGLTVPLAAIAVVLGTPWALVLAFFFALPLLLVQDAVRYVGFADDEPRRSFLVDLVWFVIQFGVLAFVLITIEDPSLFAIAGAWLLGGAVAGLVFWVMSGIGRAAIPFREYVRANRQNLQRLLRENLAGRLAPSIAVVLVGFVLSDLEIGEAFTPRTILGPVNIFFVSATSYGLAVARRMHDRSNEAFARFIRLLSFGLPAIAAAAAGVVLLLPARVVGWVTDVDISDFRRAVFVVGLGMCFAGLNHARRVGVRILGRVDVTARVETWAAGLLLSFAFLGSIAFGPLGAISGIALAHVVSSGLWFRAERSTKQLPVVAR